GLITGACWGQSATCRPLKPRQLTISNLTSPPRRRDSHQRASVKPGAVHFLVRGSRVLEQLLETADDVFALALDLLVLAPLRAREVLMNYSRQAFQAMA